MRIDRTHKSWLIASLIILGMAAAIYIPYARNSIHGPSGGSAIGLTFGIIGSAFMVFSGLLAARKKLEIWRLGRAQSWMRGHLWLGLLSLPIILFHGGFRFGGPLTSVLMVLLILVVVSGLFGAALQHYMPKVMTSEVPYETIFEQIDHVRAQLLAEADELMARASAPFRLVAAAPSGDLAATADSILSAEETLAPLRNFYGREMRPFLEESGGRNHVLADAEKARGIFSGLRRLLPAEAHETTNSLEEICEEERQLRRQVRLHHLLHDWLLLHIPLSFALLLLACVHAVMALRF
ncbi:MAG TPA: hypothetical protein VEX69_04215 [Candidatus Limnocylindria bacterium]|nr:hypothetical protein [Candidatus Limnocylindria bacterium]